MIIADENQSIFHLRNKKISYIIYLLSNHHLGHLYFGNSLRVDEDLSFVLKNENKAAGTVKFSENERAFSLAAEMQEYPVRWTSDYRQPAIEVRNGNEILYPNFTFHSFEIQQGKEANEIMPTTFGNKSDSETLSILLEDSLLKLQLKLNYTIFHDLAAVVRNAEIINLSSNIYTLSRFMSLSVDLDDCNYDFISLSGAWLKERQVKRRSLEQGIQSIESVRGASSHHHNPFIGLSRKSADENSGEVIGSVLLYSGNFLGLVEVDEWGTSRLIMGINPDGFLWQLKPGDTFSSPEAVLVYSNQGMNGMSQNFHDLFRNHLMQKRWLKESRMIAVNSWEASYFDFDEESLYKLAEVSKEIGADLFVIDDGWFGRRDSDRSSLGDWYPNLRKFPKGIKKFAEKIHNLGLKLGLWFEPEMVNEDSDLYRNHPDWIIGKMGMRRSVGRGQLVLDMSNPAVIEYLFEKIKMVIEEAKLDYIKWDMNRNITEAYSNYLSHSQQGELFHRYILGVYKLMRKISDNYPNVMIENCAGGGGRFDGGMLFYSPQIWTSDNSDAISRLNIQFGTSYVYPLSSISAHVTAVPNHQTGRITPLQTRTDVASFGMLGYELDLNRLTSEEIMTIKHDISNYKKRQALIMHGDFYRLSPYDSNEIAWMVVSKDKRTAIVGWYQILAMPNPRNKSFLKLVGLNSDFHYKIAGEEGSYSGNVLKNIGLKLPYQFNGANDNTAEMRGDFLSKIFELKAVD